jgi:two-component system LytT family response regulator
MLGSHTDVVCVGEASNGVEALEKVDEFAPDLIFLDIQMPELDGLSVAASLPNPGPKVVFITAHDEHAVRAFELAAVDYLLKPVKRERLNTTLERVRGAATSGVLTEPGLEARRATKSRRMAVRTGAKYVVFDIDRIAAILSQDHYSLILVDGQELLSDESLDKLMNRLDEQQFLRVHRGAILNLGFLQELRQEGDRKYVACVNGVPNVRVPISREKLDELRLKLGIGS